MTFPEFIFCLLALIALGFLARFVVPALWLCRDLARATAACARLEEDGERIEPESLASALSASRFARARREFLQTLQAPLSSGQRWRSTLPAEACFSAEMLVETPLKTEFYKHLPGILTGIGIIGTFAGLIAGLTHFEVDSNTAVVRLGLQNLIRGVGDAFRVSALAITLAMLATWIEKSLTTLCLRRLDRLCERIDRLFEGGVEEEYLARLVRACEASAAAGDERTQALTRELSRTLSAWSRAQQEETARQQQNMASALAEAVRAGLETPLSRFLEAVTRRTGEQSAAFAQSLAPLLENAVQRLEASQGGGKLELMLNRLGETLRQTALDLRQATARLDAAGQGAAAQAVGQLQRAGEGAGQAAASFVEASGNWSQAAAVLSEAAREAGRTIREQSENREAMAAMLAEVRGIVESLRREAGLTADLVARMEAAGASLGQAELAAGRYFEGVNRVLAEAHARFAENVEHTLREGNAQFQREMALAVDYLKTAIEDLGDTLETLASRRP